MICANYWEVIADTQEVKNAGVLFENELQLYLLYEDLALLLDCLDDW